MSKKKNCGSFSIQTLQYFSGTETFFEQRGQKIYGKI